SDRFGRRSVLALAFAIFALTYLAFGLTREAVPIACCFILYGMYQGISRSVGKTLATDLVPPPLHASGVGWYTAATGLTGLVASLVAGYLWDRVGHAAVFFYGASCATAGIVALFRFVPSDTRA